MTPELIEKINVITNSFDAKTQAARVLACKCIAAGLDARGNLSNQDGSVWNLGETLRKCSKDEASRTQMLDRLTRIVSLPFNQAVPYIYSLCRYLVAKGVPVNYTRLYWDLINMQLGQKNIQHAWVTSFAQLA